AEPPEIADLHRPSVRTDRITVPALKGAVHIAQEHNHGVGLKCNHGKIRPTIAIEVPHGHRTGRATDGEGLAESEGAVAVPQKDTDRTVEIGKIAFVGYHQVEVPGAGKVAHGNVARVGAGDIVLGRLKGAVAITEEDINPGTRLDRQVEVAAVVEVPGRQAG